MLSSKTIFDQHFHFVNDEDISDSVVVGGVDNHDAHNENKENDDDDGKFLMPCYPFSENVPRPSIILKTYDCQILNLCYSREHSLWWP